MPKHRSKSTKNTELQESSGSHFGRCTAKTAAPSLGPTLTAGHLSRRRPDGRKCKFRPAGHLAPASAGKFGPKPRVTNARLPALTNCARQELGTSSFRFCARRGANIDPSMANVEYKRHEHMVSKQQTHHIMVRDGAFPGPPFGHIVCRIRFPPGSLGFVFVLVCRRLCIFHVSGPCHRSDPQRRACPKNPKRVETCKLHRCLAILAKNTNGLRIQSEGGQTWHGF